MRLALEGGDGSGGESAEYLLELRARVGNGFRIRFRNSHVWMAIPQSDNWFEGNVHTPVNDRAQLKNILFQLWRCFQIVEELDLDEGLVAETTPG